MLSNETCLPPIFILGIALILFEIFFTHSLILFSDMADITIGEGSHSISQEARKKVSIAVELVSKPGLLFLDEPSKI